MLRTEAVVRTVWSKALEVTTRQGANGPFEAKEILFRVATDRNYKVTRTVNGQQVTEAPTDFILCRATGAVAQAFADNCTAVDKEGKLISRHLHVVGHIETYQAPRKIPVNAQVNYNGQILNIALETEIKVDGHIFVVDEFEFLDPKPREVSTVPGATVSNINITPVQANVAPVTNSATPVQMNAQAPVMSQNVAPAQSAPVYQATVVDPLAGAMNAPIPQVSTDFSVTGAQAPF